MRATATARNQGEAQRPTQAHLRPVASARTYPYLLTGLLCAGFALRLPLLDRFPLRADEAIYGYWALYGTRVDPMFLHVWPDKPPIFIWLLGSAFQLAGTAAPEVARWLSIAASTLTIAVLAAAARRWWGPVAGVVAAALTALNPLAIGFAPTVYTDALLVLTGSLALALAARGRAFWAGCWLGIAIMTKQQGLLFVPLVLPALYLHGEGTGNRRAPVQVAPGKPPVGTSMHRVRTRGDGHDASMSLPAAHLGPQLLAWGSRGLRLAAGMAVIILPILFWDSQRWAVAPSPWELGARNVGALVLAAPAQWVARFWAWTALAAQLQVSWLAWLLWTVAVGGALWLARREPQPARAPAFLLLAWGAGFFMLHWLTNVQVWDRYLLPLTMPVILLGAWAGAVCWHAWRTQEAVGQRRQRQRWVVGALAGCCVWLAVLPPAVQAAQGQLPVGGDHGDYAGLDAALRYVDRAAAGKGVLYHRELGWQAQYYLFDAIQGGAVDLRYFPSAAYLADSATKRPQRAQFLVVPDWAPVRDLDFHLTTRGWQAEPLLRAGKFTVFRLANANGGTQQPWRVCQPRAPFASLFPAQNWCSQP